MNWIKSQDVVSTVINRKKVEAVYDIYTLHLGHFVLRVVESTYLDPQGEVKDRGVFYGEFSVLRKDGNDESYDDPIIEVRDIKDADEAKKALIGKAFGVFRDSIHQLSLLGMAAEQGILPEGKE